MGHRHRVVCAQDIEIRVQARPLPRGLPLAMLRLQTPVLLPQTTEKPTVLQQHKRRALALLRLDCSATMPMYKMQPGAQLLVLAATPTTAVISERIIRPVSATTRITIAAPPAIIDQHQPGLGASVRPRAEDSLAVIRLPTLVVVVGCLGLQGGWTRLIQNSE